jgi:hypothetical protein
LASNSPRQAFEAFATPLQRAMSLVVPGGRGVLVYSPMPLRLDLNLSLSFPNGAPVRLAAAGLHLEFVHDFRIVEQEGGFSVVSTGYWFSLLDDGRRELVAYHHHPMGESWCTYPHVHVATATSSIIGKAHLVTGPLTLQAFIRMLIEDPAFPVVSLRPDWARVLELSGESDALL